MSHAPFYTVVGNPIAHSKSPFIQQSFAADCSINLRYERVRLPMAGGASAFSTNMNRLATLGLQGSNVTVPFKLDAFALATTHTQRALDAQAVNTLKRLPDGTWLGDNTDGTGIVNDLIRLRGTLQGARVLVMGAGGAVQGTLAPLLAAGATVHVSNRTESKAHDLAKLFNINAHGLTDVLPPCDIIINATAASLQGLALAPNPGALHADALAYDMMYKPTGTPFTDLCAARGARVADGIGMLIEQAAESFFLWHGVRPDTAAMHAYFAKK